MTKTLERLAPAKLNLFLHVTGRRADGYHELQSLFVPIDLCDRLRFTRRDDAQIERLGSTAHARFEDDLIIRAARLMQAYKPEAGVSIEVQKQIPSGAGLGGGSSDAACALAALNQLWQINLSVAQLQRLGLQLGADVPFFMQQQAAIVEGIGEIVHAVALDVPPAYVLISPNLSIATPAIFKHPTLQRNTPTLDLDSLQQQFQDCAQRSVSAYLEHFRNDLQAVACQLHPALQSMLQTLETMGLQAQMTGSGSNFYIPVADLAQAQQLVKDLSRVFSEQGSAKQPPAAWQSLMPFKFTAASLYLPA
ncbi:4-(cytidine 5'-diphospho)-2-C-methyl-D-erythritol kinase [Brackiella oedipodis]|uniref:4-(cytidine 5'-diphospho)-2-C-methyl-D-erythritol kinase n=1 Tax=Brackiella oedipodis TaxID=124225 RepID=UPI000687572E|nr:4-(cytidine 5'-diphospho)-2-C-methyl-D-erythritol kinase [Brackiella oedipodis]